MVNIEPAKVILPIVRIGSNKAISELLGTGFFVGSRPVVVTAKHVFLDNSLQQGEEYGVVIRQSDTAPIIEVEDYESSRDFDIVAFQVNEVSEWCSLRLTQEPPPTNCDVVTYEYSQTRIEKLNDHRSRVSFKSFTHKGNIMRIYTSEFPESVPTPSIITSFPALQGASGAPVVRNTDCAVVGMLVANIERDLSPAQVIKTSSEDEGEKEEIKYFLPTGKGRNPLRNNH